MILEHLKRVALERSKNYPEDHFIVRGLWRFDLLFKPTIHERTFSYTVVLAQCVRQGCCYTEENPILEKNLLGKDGRKIKSVYRSIEIAILDAIYANFEEEPESSFILDGSSVNKSIQRAEVVTNEVLAMLEKIKNYKKGKPSVVNVGTVETFIKMLRDRGIEVYATDRDRSLIGEKIHGVLVEDGIKTPELVEKCDIALVTGMTLSTGTLDEILRVAQKYGTRLIMFAETGANFGKEYCRLGIDVVVSEPFPFYIFQGRSIINVYRKD